MLLKIDKVPIKHLINLKNRAPFLQFYCQEKRDFVMIPHVLRISMIFFLLILIHFTSVLGWFLNGYLQYCFGFCNYALYLHVAAEYLGSVVLYGL